MPGGRIVISSLTAEEARNARLFNAVGWCFGIILITWAVWMPPSIDNLKAAGALNLQAKVAFTPAPHFSITWAILITLISPGIGWLLGWKAGVYPFFSGHIISNEPKSPTTV